MPTVTSTSKGENTYQRTGPREQWFISEMGEFGGHLADRAVELSYHRLRVALTDSVDQRAEAPGFRLACHWKLINSNYQFLARKLALLLRQLEMHQDAPRCTARKKEK